MNTHFIEVTNGWNWGKFMLARFDADEWNRRSSVGDLDTPLLREVGWSPEHLLVWDLQTGEGAIFRPGGYAKADLDKHAVWVCPMFQPFLAWLYAQDVSDITKLPHLVELTETAAPSAMYGYRRPGPLTQDEEQLLGDLGYGGVL